MQLAGPVHRHDQDGPDDQRCGAEQREYPADERERQGLHTGVPQAGRFVAMAVRMPWINAIGVGGQPGTATSTGITFATRPQLA